MQALDLATGFDVSDPDAWEEVDGAEFAFLNAGVGGSGSDLAGYRRMLGANIDGVVFGVRRMEQVMTPGGSIVATASLAGLMPMPADPIYTLTKHAVVGYVRAMAPHLAERGIRINAICPGFVDTPIVTAELRAWIASEGIPLMQPEQVAEAVLVAARSERFRARVGRATRSGAAALRVPRGARAAMSVYRTQDQHFAAIADFPFEPRYADHDGLRMHYVDEGEGDPVLCLHGEPTWSYLYRKMIPTLSRTARVVAPDYLGFGRSDKPTDRDWYSFDRHYGSILGLVESLELERLTVVVQDWGGPIGMRLAVEQPDRVARLVILNTGVGGGRAPNDVWLRFRDVVRAAGGDFQPGRLIRTASVRGLSDEAMAAYDAPFPTPESKAGPIMFPEQVPTEPEHPNAAPMLAIREAMKEWQSRHWCSSATPIRSSRRRWPRGLRS